MEDIEQKLLSLPLVRPSDALDQRVFAAKSEGDAAQPTVKASGGRFSRFARMSPLVKTTAAVLIAAFLICTGWAAEKVYEKVTSLWVEVKTTPLEDWTLPDGKKLTYGLCTMTTVDSDNPNAAKNAKLHHEEMERLIAEKKYEFVKTCESGSGKCYVYKFTFSDGSHENNNFSMPLDKVASWDDYQRKDKEQTQKRREQINKALAAGRFRLINVEVICIHVCQDPATNQKSRVQRISKDKALVRPFDNEKQATTMPMTSWQDHLKAIRKGERILLSLETVSLYNYEVTLEDGSTTIFTYGGGDPLKKADSAKTEKKDHPGK